MNEPATELPAVTRRNPKKIRTIIIGANQNFFRSFINFQKSLIELIS